MFPCVKSRVIQGSIKPADVKILKDLINERKDPSHELLARCFPVAIESFKKHSGIYPLAPEPWPIEAVRNYWRQHKGKSKGCAVMYGEVETIDNICIGVICRNKKKSKKVIITVFNKYGFPLCIGDTVYFHSHAITEVERRTAPLPSKKIS